MDLQVVARLAKLAPNDDELRRLITSARRVATEDQLAGLTAVEQDNRYRLAIKRREGSSDLDGRVQEAVRVVEALYSRKNGKPTQASRTRQSLKRWGTVEALRRVIAKRDSPGLRILAEHDRLDCAFEQIALDFPDVFRGGDTLAIASETLDRERTAQGGS